MRIIWCDPYFCNNCTFADAFGLCEKKIALSPAYQIAALPKESQEQLFDTIESEQATPSLSQAQRLRKLSQAGELNEDTMLSIMMEQKKPERNDITLSGDKLKKYFPRSYSPKRIEETIFNLLDAWLKKRQRENSRYYPMNPTSFLAGDFLCPKEHQFTHCTSVNSPTPQTMWIVSSAPSTPGKPAAAMKSVPFWQNESKPGWFPIRVPSKP